MNAGFNPFGSWEEFSAIVNRKGIAWPSLLGQSKFDDFREGTWTPSLGGTATYQNQQGYYLQVGKLIFVRMVLQVLVIGTGSTTIITGLPFVVGQATKGICYFGVSDWQSAATNIVYAVGRLTPSQSDVVIRSTTGAIGTLGSNDIFGNGTVLQGSGCYSIN